VVGLAIVGFLLLVIIGIQLRFFLRRRSQQSTTWNTLLARIEPLNFADLEINWSCSHRRCGACWAVRTACLGSAAMPK
jgi:hypothetical protein